MQPPQMPQPAPPQPWTPGQATAYPAPYPPYYVPPRRDDSSKVLIIVLVVIVVVVAATVGLAAVFYFMVSGLLTDGGGPGPRAMGVSVQATPDGTNWSVVIQTGPSGELPASTYLLIRNPQGVIVLSRTSFSGLTWPTNHAVYADASPTVTEIRPGDSLLISRTTYPSGSQIEISDDAGVLTSRTLQ